MDAYATERNATTVNFKEYNPLMRPFVTHGTFMLSAAFSTELSASLQAEAWLRRRRHGRLAYALQLGEIAGHSYGAYYSFSHYQSNRRTAY